MRPPGEALGIHTDECRQVKAHRLVPETIQALPPCLCGKEDHSRCNEGKVPFLGGLSRSLPLPVLRVNDWDSRCLFSGGVGLSSLTVVFFSREERRNLADRSPWRGWREREGSLFQKECLCGGVVLAVTLGFPF